MIIQEIDYITLLMQILYTNYETPFIQPAKVRLSQLESIAKEMPTILKCKLKNK